VSNRAEQPQNEENDEHQAKNTSDPAITPPAVTEATAAQKNDQ